MNIVLEAAEEWSAGTRHRTFGDTFIRGNNGTKYYVMILIACSFIHQSPLTLVHSLIKCITGPMTTVESPGKECQNSKM